MKFASNVIVLTVIIFLVSCKKTDVTPNNPPEVNSLDTGLIAYYPFSGNAKDSSENHYNLTVNNATLTNNRFGIPNKAYYFNGTDAMLTVPEYTNASSLNNFSISVWVNPENVDGCIFSLFGQEFYENRGQLMAIRMNTYSGQFEEINALSSSVSTNGSGASIFFPVIVSDPTNKWTHFVLFQNNEVVRLYVNGKKSDAVLPSLGPVDFSKGGAVGKAIIQINDIGFFTGIIDEVRIYRRALTEREIIKLYEE